MHLSEALYLLNKLFSAQLFLTLCLCFCCTLLDINYEIFGYFDGRIGKLKFAVVIWVLGFSLRFITVVAVANRTCLKAKYAGTLVTSMANRFLDDDTKEELMLFSKHVLSNEFEFTACGFFALNMGLVTSAIATGTTYLVILLQFQP
ncbi:putative gustatory receptor 28b [Bemisia tabaci]|uniref:putative gustatory receptor 28b n=1 Tax=Bemisia tabaci TaxID=7038 RepID=UPI001948057C